jgi:CHAT domain-containing protein
VVPDKVLYGIPFGALRDRSTGRFLLQDREIVLAPSASFLRASLRRRPPAAVAGDALLVRPSARDLQESGPELDDLRGLYPAASVLAGPEARKPAILARLDGHRLFHYIGHAEVHPENPFHSRLKLGPGGDDLTVGDLQGRRFERLDLVVLSACSTVVAEPTRSGGFLGLARPFLSGGVRSVVGTLWDVDDAASRAVLVAFHRRLGSGGSPAAALRAAQVEALQSGWPPSAWAAFAIVGRS